MGLGSATSVLTKSSSSSSTPNVTYGATSTATGTSSNRVTTTPNPSGDVTLDADATTEKITTSDNSSGGGTYYGSASSSSGGGGDSGSSGGGSSSSTWSTDKIVSDPDAADNYLGTTDNAEATKDILGTGGLDLDADVDIGKVDHVDIDEEKAMLDQLKQSQVDQSNAQIDNSVNENITELQRTQEDAQEEYQTQRDQIDAELQRALDNSVLTSAARGDRGGIGVAQYNTLQNTAATNKFTVQKEQTKLATDTARQIADLRSQGEFQKADNLLSITQNYLSQLMSLYQWADETNLGVDEFNLQVDEWEENYKLSLVDAELSVANATGAFSNGTATYTASQQATSALAASGQSLLQAGVLPTEEQLKAMGMSKQQAVDYLNKYFP